MARTNRPEAPKQGGSGSGKRKRGGNKKKTNASQNGQKRNAEKVRNDVQAMDGLDIDIDGLEFLDEPLFLDDVFLGGPGFSWPDDPTTDLKEIDMQSDHPNTLANATGASSKDSASLDPAPKHQVVPPRTKKKGGNGSASGSGQKRKSKSTLTRKSSKQKRPAADTVPVEPEAVQGSFAMSPVQPGTKKRKHNCGYSKYSELLSDANNPSMHGLGHTEAGPGLGTVMPTPEIFAPGGGATTGHRRGAKGHKFRDLPTKNNRGRLNHKKMRLNQQQQREHDKIFDHSHVFKTQDPGAERRYDPNVGHVHTTSTPTERENFFPPYWNDASSASETFHEMYPNLYRIFYLSSNTEGPKFSMSSDVNPNMLMNIVFNFVGTRIEPSHEMLGKPLSTTSLDTLTKKIFYIGIDETSIGLSKSFLANVKRDQIIAELRSLLTKVKEQSKFLTKQMCQMSLWSRSAFGGMNSTTGRGSDGATTKHKNTNQNIFTDSVSDLALTTGVDKEIIDRIISPPVPYPVALTVKIICAGMKKSDCRPLDALITPDSTMSPSLLAVGTHVFPQAKKPPIKVKSPLKKKKEKLQTSSTTNPPPTQTSTIKKSSTVPGEQSYNDLDYLGKQAFIRKLLTKRASAMQKKVLKAHVERQDELNKREHKICNTVDKYGENRLMDTTQFWDLVKLSGHFDDKPAKADIEAELSSLWQPELPRREVYRTVQPTPTIIKSESNKTQNSDEFKHAAPHPLFDRLQSLLVEEDGDGDEDSEETPVEDIDEASSASNDSISLEDLNVMDSECGYEHKSGLADLSSLTLDQRSYIHLRSMNLIDQPLFLSSRPSVVEKEEVQIADSKAKSYGGARRIEDDINSAVYQMQMDLSSKHKDNNTKLAFLRTQALRHVSDVSHRERMEEEYT